MRAIKLTAAILILYSLPYTITAQPANIQKYIMIDQFGYRPQDPKFAVIVDPVLGTYTIDTSTDPPDRIIYGPFTNSQQMAMRASGGFTPTFGEQTLESTLCGTCH